MPTIADIEVGYKLPNRIHTPTNVTLFLYNAAVWNAHRIHYDERYAIEGEGHAGVVVDGPLQGDWLSQAVLNWIGDDGELVSFSYSNRRASYLGESLTSGGQVTTIDSETGIVELELSITNEAGEVVTPGTAIARLNNGAS